MAAATALMNTDGIMVVFIFGCVFVLVQSAAGIHFLPRKFISVQKQTLEGAGPLPRRGCRMDGIPTRARFSGILQYAWLKTPSENWLSRSALITF